MSKFNPIYPWQNALWHSLTQSRSKLHHAFLMYGRAGVGKYDFALNFSQSLLCPNKNETGHACQQCASCHWFSDESHPDFRLITPEQNDSADEDVSSAKKTKKKTQISVAQIRELSDFLSLSSHQSSGLRIVLIHPAEALNLAAANALLKMLEEPAPDVVFILIAHQLQRLLPTVLSRCQKIKMPIPDQTQALGWLNANGVSNAAQQLAYMEGSPIKVFNEQADFAHLTQIWGQLALGQKLDPQFVAPLVIAHSVEMGVIAIQKWIYDILAVKLSQQVRYHLQHANALQALAEKVNLGKLFDFQKKTNELRKLATHPLNHELQMESLLVDYTKLFRV
ncbi:MAG: DNA polymerase III subunit delta' [Methylotenera sp. 24-45-7]|jgi:DNA polymerase-3 subunit delta'|nr:MAG: DNA polymerase III subunit delta' [Methylotenera sp. 24-45-7]HQS43841.1 DNA polymerase III subunit delta' [Methylotenera sp.]